MSYKITIATAKVNFDITQKYADLYESYLQRQDLYSISNWVPFCSDKLLHIFYGSKKSTWYALHLIIF